MSRSKTKQLAASPARPYEIICGDCLHEMTRLPDGGFSLIATDPPYNLGREYDIYDDRKPLDEYLTWAEAWLQAIYRLAAANGSFWLAIGASLVSELDVLAKRVGFHKRGHIVWFFGFGMNNPKNFTRAHTHWLYYTKHRKKFTFNAQDPGLRVPSARQLQYNDKRADSRGRLPDDVWILRPNEIRDAINKQDMDVWIHSRICGTYRERVPDADNQIPVALMERIIRASSNPGDHVLDPFSGVASTGVAAINLGRKYTGIELSEKYTKQGNARLEAAWQAQQTGS